MRPLHQSFFYSLLFGFFFLFPGPISVSNTAGRDGLYEFLQSCMDHLKPDPAYDKTVSFVLVSNDWSQRVEYCEGSMVPALSLAKNSSMQRFMCTGVQYLNSDRYDPAGMESVPFDPGKTTTKTFYINFSRTRIEIEMDGIKIANLQFLPAFSLGGQNIFSGAVYGHEEIPDGYNDMGGSKPYRFTLWALSITKNSTPHKTKIPGPQSKQY